MIKLRHKNKFISLNLKLTLAIMIGVILAVGMYFACQGFTTLVVNKIYLSDEYVKDVADSQYASLEQYIKDDNVKGTDTKKLNAWIQDEKYSYLYVYDNKKTAFEAGWWVDSDSNSGESVSAGTEAAANTDSDVRIDEDKFDADEKNRIVQFADAKYYVYLDSYKEMGFYNIMNDNNQGVNEVSGDDAYVSGGTAGTYSVSTGSVYAIGGKTIYTMSVVYNESGSGNTDNSDKIISKLQEIINGLQ